MTRPELQAYWQGQVAAQEASGLSGWAWCEREGVCYSTFLRWRRRLQDIPGVKPLTLIPVRPELPSNRPLVVTVGAARIEVQAQFDPSVPRQVVVALAGLS